ncbi:MAG: ABC transporter permease [Pirellulaceae bacterium]|nr:ABC transporter permease [Pirellulaceae bacterium]
MYKLLLSWRYLRTRYIALASIVSVTLGVGTLIVVNSVMAGFAHEMHVRLKGILSDIVFESHSLDGFTRPDWHAAEIRKVAGDDLVSMTTAVHVPAIVHIKARGQLLPRQVMLIGVDEATYGDVSQFREYLLHAENRKKLSFQLREDGYGDKDHPLPPSGWKHRRVAQTLEREYLQQQEEMYRESQKLEGSQPLPLKCDSEIPESPFARSKPEENTEEFDKTQEQYTGAILGIALGCIKQRDLEGKVKDYYLCRPGDDVTVTFASAGQKPQALNQQFTVVDFYESKMSEYDSGFVFVPLKALQEARGMTDAVTTIQLKLRPGADLNAIRDKLRARFPAEEYPYRIQTWRDMQGPLLAAVQMETTLLNILLFLIIAVAGFGILATFFMIVVEKTKDIGILKALGAPSRGVMSIFLSYGFSLGLVGSGAGMAGGLLFVVYINDIAKVIEWMTGHEVFDPTVYYFSRIPTIIEPLTVLGVVCGAVLIAVMASVLPALRAARLHPVQALRYE